VGRTGKVFSLLHTRTSASPPKSDMCSAVTNVSYGSTGLRKGLCPGVLVGIDDFYAALSTTSLAALSITMGASKYWNSGLEPKIDWIASSKAGPCAFFAVSMFFQR
jgi:hypothetical protein